MREVENSWREDLDCVSTPIDLYVHGIITCIFILQISCIEYSLIIVPSYGCKRLISHISKTPKSSKPGNR